MKKTFYLFAVVTMLSSCVSGNTKPHTDLEKQCINGNVKSITTTLYNVQEVFGDYEPTSLCDEYFLMCQGTFNLQEFNEDGNIVHAEDLDKDHNMIASYTNVYDGNNIVEYEFHNNLYNSNFTQYRTYKDGKCVDMFLKPDVPTTEVLKYTFNDNGDLVESKTYDGDVLKSKFIFKYNDYHMQTSMISYDGEGKEIYRSECEYQDGIYRTAERNYRDGKKENSLHVKYENKFLVEAKYLSDNDEYNISCSYKYFANDEKGNWTKCLLEDQDGTKALMIRKIEYYD